MSPLELIDTDERSSLILGEGDATGVVAALGHTPNGYFWEGVARAVVRRYAPELSDRIRWDSDAAQMVAYSEDRSALVQLGELLAPVVTDPARLRALVEAADPADF